MINQYLPSHSGEVTDGEKIWDVAQLCGLIMEINLFSKELRCIWKIPNSPHTCDYRSSLFYWDHKLYIFPYNQGGMYIYDLFTSKYEEIKVKKELELMGVVKRNQFLYAYGAKSTILKYNLEKGTVTYIDVQSKLYKLKNIPQICFWTKSFVADGNIYIPVSGTNAMIILDQNDEVSLLTLGKKMEKWILQNIQMDNGRYCAIYGQGKINDISTYVSEYDLNGKLIWKSSIKENYSYQFYPFLDVILIGDKWLFLPFGRNEVLIRDKTHEEILFVIENGIEFSSDIIQGLFYCNVWVNDHTVYSINQAAGSLICIDIDNLAISHSYLELKEDLGCIVEKVFQDAVRFRSIINESKEFYNIKSYIRFICNCKKM